MKKQLTLAVAALLSVAPSATADHGRTVCVFRARPVAIQPVHRPAATVHRPQFTASPATAYRGHAGYHYHPGYRVPVTYGHFIQRTHYVSPFRPNGYVGGLRNLPTNYVQIPPTFGRAGFHTHAGHGHGGHGGQGGHGGGGHGGGHRGR